MSLGDPHFQVENGLGLLGAAFHAGQIEDLLDEGQIGVAITLIVFFQVEVAIRQAETGLADKDGVARGGRPDRG